VLAQLQSHGVGKESATEDETGGLVAQ